MTTATDIANYALSVVLGEGTIGDISDPEKAAELCTQNFETALDYVINEGKFPGTIRRTTLTPFGTPIGDWGSSYQFPSGYLSAIGLESGMAWQAPDGLLMTNDTAAVLVYRYRPTSYGALSNSFKAAVACRLAFLVAFDLTNDQAKVNLANAEYVAARRVALRDAAMTLTNQPAKRPRWGAARTR